MSEQEKVKFFKLKGIDVKKFRYGISSLFFKEEYKEYIKIMEVEVK